MRPPFVEIKRMDEEGGEYQVAVDYVANVL